LFGDLDVSGTAHHAVGAEHALLERRGGGDDLADAARFEDVRDGAVAAHGLVGLAGLVGVEGGTEASARTSPVRHVQDRRAAALGLSLGQLVGQHLLRVPLDVAVDRQLHVATGLRRTVRVLPLGRCGRRRRSRRPWCRSSREHVVVAAPRCRLRRCPRRS
jgi:hypothetical protein